MSARNHILELKQRIAPAVIGSAAETEAQGVTKDRALHEGLNQVTVASP
jgi:hypothetical protein